MAKAGSSLQSRRKRSSKPYDVSNASILGLNPKSALTLCRSAMGCRWRRASQVVTIGLLNENQLLYFSIKESRAEGHSVDMSCGFSI
uniref:Uncharacterized protein n=1 Tax=Timema bartmani TaxID=61472 RepID=A0A7R9F405_9NEOP|nr:unnamed protein product [Timema bartmani]